jgi:hypothetical protein
VAFSDLSVLFPGVAGDVVTLGDVDTLDHDWENDDRTYSFWFKMGAALRTLMGKRDNFNTQGWWIYMDTGRIGFEIREPAFLRALKVQNNTGPLVGDSAWHHGAIVITAPASSANAKIYLDGLLYAHTAFTDSLLSGDVTVNNDPMIFGHHQLTAGGPAAMTGNLDELAFYSAALSAPQVIELFNEGNPTHPKILTSWADNIGYWSMGDGDTFPTLQDRGNGTSNDGTMTGGLLAGDIVSDAPLQTSFSGNIDQPFVPDIFEAGQHRGFERAMQGSGSAGGGVTLFFKMRAEQDPGPGYEVWVVSGTPDFAGSGAGGPIIPGTAVVVSEWPT